MKLVIDNREDNKRINSATRFFSTYSVKTDQLPIGDYLFEDKIIFEYKTPSDMINSIIDGRIFRQAHNMKQYPFSFVIIVGNVADEINRRNEPKYWNKYNKIRTFTIKSYLGALARLYTYTRVIHVDNNQQAWTLMQYLVEKLLEDNKDIKAIEKPQFKLTDPIASFLGCIYVNKSQRLSIKQAVLIREHLHLETLQDLLDVSYEDLVDIKGIGSKTAKAVMEVIK